MNNNETNYEFVNRDYDGVINGNEKKIQFYSRTFSTIYDKYKVWHYDQIMKKKILAFNLSMESGTYKVMKVFLS